MGFGEVYDYVAGKQDWLARGLSIEGDQVELPTAGTVARSDVVTCRLDDRVGEVRERVIASPYGFALVVSEDGCLLGRLRGSELERCDPGSTAEEVMEPGPSTVRLDSDLAALVERLRGRNLMFAVVTRPDGTLAGVVRRSDAERHLSGKD
jgi:CBS domain-containing protein